MNILKRLITPAVNELLEELNIDKNILDDLIEKPRDLTVCDLCIPCFALAKILKKNPVEIAKDISSSLKNKLIPEIFVITKNGYVNFNLDTKFIAKKLLDENYEFFQNSIKNDVLIEHTSANPNGPFHVGRARNAILGDALVRLNREFGNKVIAEYYVDDMGKQVGILAWALENLTEKDVDEILENEGIESLNPTWINKEDHIRVRWYQAANIIRKDDKKIELELSELIKKSEEGDESVLSKFNDSFKPILNGMLETLSKLGIKYDSFTTESKFIINGRVNSIMEELKKSKLYGKAENGANYLELAGKGVSGKSTKFFFQRGDGSSLYATRDLAYHEWKWTRASKLINILGEDHRLQSKQVSIALEELKIKKPEVLFYSFIKLPEGKMSTRRGNVVFMDDLIAEAENMAMKIINQRGHNIEDKRSLEISKAVASSAIRFNILKVSPEKGFTFKWEDAMSFDADSAPFIMYSHARSCSINKKVNELKFEEINIDYSKVEINKSAANLLRTLMRFEDSLEKSITENKPNHFCTFMLELATKYNSFYRDCIIIENQNVNVFHYKVSEYSRKLIYRGCNALGIIPLVSM
ncbi:MAG: arginine--tRNA ligase [Methanobacteriota archaeon]|nr:MAG: arginine--tRNA ligase [Euryarchaeota archaeon]|tara:strand:- start:33636 stop:35390 length:1755 start_codon:yes stop_codon:yes gene_type:complete